jgi:hypothetical protein
MKGPRTAALALPVAALCALLLPAGAAALEVQPGLWEFQITIQGGLMGNQVVTQQQCLQETDLDPSMFSTTMGPCSIGRIDESSTGLRWDFSCNLQGMESSGAGTMTAVGDTVRGTVSLTMAMPAQAGGQQFTLTNTWAGRRVGDCF